MFYLLWLQRIITKEDSECIKESKNRFEKIASQKGIGKRITSSDI